MWRRVVRRGRQLTENSHGGNPPVLEKKDNTGRTPTLHWGVEPVEHDAVLLCDHRAGRSTAGVNVERGTVPRGLPSKYWTPIHGSARLPFFRILGRVKTLLPIALVIVVTLQADPHPLAARSKGRAEAPVTVYEMADFQCPACRMFAVTVLPALDSEYVRTGKVRWVFINLPLTSIHPNAVAAAEVAMCAARQGRFWPTHDLLYRQQDHWAPLAQPHDTLVDLAERAGVNRAKLLACLKSGDARKEVELDAQRAARSGAHATPSFYMEGGLLEGAPYTADPMRRLLDSIYAARMHAPPPK